MDKLDVCVCMCVCRSQCVINLYINSLLWVYVYRIGANGTVSLFTHWYTPTSTQIYTHLNIYSTSICIAYSQHLALTSYTYSERFFFLKSLKHFQPIKCSQMLTTMNTYKLQMGEWTLRAFI